LTSFGSNKRKTLCETPDGYSGFYLRIRRLSFASTYPRAESG
jgi:hypothetical protein